jgi:hypothetical protein
MSHRPTILAFRDGFGFIAKCVMGNYHIHLPWISFRLDEKGFDQFIQMILEAKQRKHFNLSNEGGLKERAHGDEEN